MTDTDEPGGMMKPDEQIRIVEYRNVEAISIKGSPGLIFQRSNKESKNRVRILT